MRLEYAESENRYYIHYGYSGRSLFVGGSYNFRLSPSWLTNVWQKVADGFGCRLQERSYHNADASEIESAQISASHSQLGTSSLAGRLVGASADVRRRRTISACLSANRSEAIRRIAGEQRIHLPKLQRAVWRARRVEFLANTTGVAAAVR